MAQHLSADWESRDCYLSPLPFLDGLGAKSPYVLFGLKGENVHDLKEAWYGPPELRHGPPKNSVQKRRQVLWPLLAIPSVLLLLGRYGAAHGPVHEYLVQNEWLAWLAFAALFYQFVIFRPSQAEIDATQQQKTRIEESGVMTVLLRVPNHGFAMTQAPHSVLHRKRGDEPQWARELAPGYVLVVLEGLTPAEAKEIYQRVLALNPVD